jgi:hypothetical protein
MAGFSTLKPYTGKSDNVRLEEVVEMQSWEEGDNNVRFLNRPIIHIRRHWLHLRTKAGKVINIPRYCMSHNPLNEDEPRTNAKGKEIECPYCELPHGKNKDSGSAHFESFYLAQAISRELQEEEPRKKAKPTKDEKKTGFKDIRSKSWTPIRVYRLPSTLVARLQELSGMNKVRNKKSGTKKAYDITDDKYGCDIVVRYKAKASGSDKYSADIDERTPLTDDEKEYLAWDLSETLLDVTGRFSESKQALDDMAKMEIVGGDVPDGTDLDDDDDDDDPFASKKKKKSGKKKKAFDSDDDDDDDDDDDEPVKKKKSKKKSIKKPAKKKKAAFDDDDDDDEPVKKKKSAKKSAKKAEKKPAKKKKKKSSAWDDDDE